MTNRKNIQVSLVFISLAMIVIGVYRKEALTVLAKAIKICLECVGIG